MLTRHAVRSFAAGNTDLVENEASEITKNIVASEDKPLFTQLESYSQDAMKKYFDQEALCMPVDQIARNVVLKDYAFFLNQPQFYKVVDTLEKYQEFNVDLDT